MKMNKFIVPLLLVLGTSCKSDLQPSRELLATNEIQPPVTVSEDKTDIYSTYGAEPYEIKLEISPLGNNLFDLEINMLLNNGSYYVSPNSKGDFTGMFTLHIEENEELELISNLVETPASIEEFDPHPFVNGYVNWVRENTTYHQKLQPKTKDKIILKGYVQFTIEPRCTLEKIPFIIKYYKGEMRIEIDKC